MGADSGFGYPRTLPDFRVVIRVGTLRLRETKALSLVIGERAFLSLNVNVN
jgi:hypothetical protein